MAGITKAQAEAELAAWEAASLALAGGANSYTITTGTSSRSLTKASGYIVLKMIDYWERKVKRLSDSGRVRVRYGVNS